MNNKISTGIWLVFLGLAILLHNLDIIHFNFYAIFKYWPLAIVSVGLSLLFQGKTNGVWITTIANTAICTFLLVIGITPNSSSNTNKHGIHAGDYQEKISTDFEPTESASIEINGGAIQFIIKNPSDSGKLFEAATTGPQVLLELHKKDSTKNNLELITKINKNESSREPVELRFNSYPQWNITFNMGAASVDGDFSNHRFKNFSINSGASSFKLKYGKPTDGVSNIEINTAASSIKLLFPKDVEYAVKSDNVLSSTKIKGSKKKGSSMYKTDRYDEVEHKYHIEITGAANSFSLDTF